ncbi:Pimeloyl-ACP methyl ester carboxylesterase [Myxococcus fulvus]|uniref:Alpha/beta hydrolase n=1 Tax=Myxococcus fulvus TaxID=33 RepID=A0A511TFQ2_MYXFU|nr:alpha/beta hydrolase [Myxococcus fulvus]GEN12981.1 alpha/beta hydrolase [Myxococcus fulvus]SEU38423.1 Pimeloyl-ACP methyl ester carboxylesterase [Myxococcus fulvus]
MLKSYVALLPLALLALVGCSDDPEASFEPKDRWFTNRDGLKLHYLEFEGRGSPVVMLHGLLGSAHPSWVAPGIAGALAKQGHRLIILDQRGHGQSDRPYTASSYGEPMVLDVLELMDTLGIERAHLVGYSMGAAMTRVLMTRAPERVISASLGGAGVEELDPVIRAEAEARDPKGTDPDEQRILDEIAGDPPPDPRFVAAITEAWTAWWPPSIDLPSLRVPVQAVNGEFDAPYSKTVRLERELAGFENVIIPGRTHLTTLIDSRYVDSLVDFIQRNDER